MADIFTLSATDLAALLCSRVCHDIISPVGAINNGLELLDEGGADEDAMKLIRATKTVGSPARMIRERQPGVAITGRPAGRSTARGS
jgi:hypothetical protein